MQFTIVRSKEKDYDIYLQLEKLVHSNQEHIKICFQAIWKWKKLVPSYFEPDKHCCSYLEREKSGSLRFGDLKNVVHNCQEQGKRLLHLFKVRKTGSQQLGPRKKCLPAIWKWKKVVPSYFETDKLCCSYLEREKSGSLLFGD